MRPPRNAPDKPPRRVNRLKNAMSRPGADGWPNPFYAWYVVILLDIAALCSYVDRFIIGILIEPIRRDLQISDTEVSLVAGTGFALFYGFMALPLGRLADRKSRVAIISTGIFCWSLLTAVAGLSRNFWQFFIARMGVGVAEASLTSSAYSLIADYFPPNRLPVAMSVYAASVMLGSSAALIVGAWVFGQMVTIGAMTFPIVGTLQPWQMTLVCVGLPGLLVSFAVATIREPTRRNRTIAEGEIMTIGEVASFMKGMKSFLVPHHIGFSVLVMYTYAIFIWAPSFLSRTYGLRLTEAGTASGATVLVAGVSGIFCGGLLGQKLAARGIKDALLRVSVYALALLVPIAAVMPLMSTPGMAILLLGLTIFTFSVSMAGAAVALQLATPNEMRGQLMAVFSLVSVVVGLGAGPSTVALLTDYWFQDPGAIRYSLAIVGAVTASVACLLVAMSLRPYRERLDLMQRAQAIRGVDDQP